MFTPRALLIVAVAVLVSGATLPHSSGYPAYTSAAPLPGVLVGRWRSEAVHHHADGTQLRERGAIQCAWILDRTYLQCDRSYVAQTGARRHSRQLYARDSVGAVIPPRVDIHPQGPELRRSWRTLPGRRSAAVARMKARTLSSRRRNKGASRSRPHAKSRRQVRPRPPFLPDDYYGPPGQTST
jgi:hypothetical protein